MPDNKTPKPKLEAIIIAAIPSIKDLAKRVSWLADNPLCREPTIAIAPTQKTKLAVTNPCEIEGPSDESGFRSLTSNQAPI